MEPAAEQKSQREGPQEKRDAGKKLIERRNRNRKKKRSEEEKRKKRRKELKRRRREKIQTETKCEEAFQKLQGQWTEFQKPEGRRGNFRKRRK